MRAVLSSPGAALDLGPRRRDLPARFGLLPILAGSHPFDLLRGLRRRGRATGHDQQAGAQGQTSEDRRDFTHALSFNSEHFHIFWHSASPFPDAVVRGAVPDFGRLRSPAHRPPGATKFAGIDRPTLLPFASPGRGTFNTLAFSDKSSRSGPCPPRSSRARSPRHRSRSPAS